MPQNSYRVIQWMTGDVDAVLAIPDVCDAAPRCLNLDLGLVRPRGLVGS